MADTSLPDDAVPIETKGTFIKWANRGDRVQGTVLRLELSKKYEGENWIAILRGDDGAKLAVSAPLKLKEAIEDHGLIGKRVVIVYADDTPAKGGTVKEFKLGMLPPLGDAFGG